MSLNFFYITFFKDILFLFHTMFMFQNIGSYNNFLKQWRFTPEVTIVLGSCSSRLYIYIYMLKKYIPTRKVYLIKTINKHPFSNLYIDIQRKIEFY